MEEDNEGVEGNDESEEEEEEEKRMDEEDDEGGDGGEEEGSQAGKGEGGWDEAAADMVGRHTKRLSLAVNPSTAPNREEEEEREGVDTRGEEPRRVEEEDGLDNPNLLMD